MLHECKLYPIYLQKTSVFWTAVSACVVLYVAWKCYSNKKYYAIIIECTVNWELIYDL
jgi:hypothetical protein